MKGFNKLSIIIAIVVIITGIYVFLGCNSNPFLGVGENTDTAAPTISVSSHSDGDYVSSSFTLSGSCSDNTKVTKVTVEKKGDSSTSALEATPGDPDSSGNQSWSINVTSTFLGTTNGEVSLIVKAYDGAGNSEKVVVALKIDTTIPTITVTEPTLKSLSFLNGLSPTKYEDLAYYQNGSFDISGMVDDEYSIHSVSVKLFAEGHISSGEEKLTMTITKDKTTYAISNSVTPSSASSYIGVDGYPSKWSFTLDSASLISNGILSDDTKYLVKVETEDMAGNSATQSTSYLYINQSSDKPYASISAPTAGGSTFPQAIANGSCFDDDGLSKIYWYVNKSSAGDPTADYTQWGDTTTDTWAAGVFDLSVDTPGIYNWQFTTPNSTGEYKIYIRPVDKNGLAADSNATVTYTQATSSSPQIQITGPNTSNTYNGTINVSTHSIGATGNVVEVWYDVSSDVASSGWIKKSSAGGDFTAGSPLDYSFSFDTSSYTSSTVHSIKVSVYCVNENSDTSQTMTTTILADNDAPSLSVSSPASSSTINGTQRIEGSASDWSLVDALYISYFENLLDAAAESTYDTQAKLDAATAGSPTKDKWYKISGPSTSWMYDYDTTVVTSGTLSNYHFHVAAVDSVGNVSFVHKTYTINQDLDKPTVTITQPSYSGSASEPWTTVDDMEKFGQDFLIMGSSNDDDGVNKVQLDIYLMDYTSSGHSINTTVDTSVDVVGTTNWSFSIEDATVCSSSQYYMVIPYVEDINGRMEKGAASYYIVSNEIPVCDIMWPSTLDPDGDQRYNSDIFAKETVHDSFGTVISNVKDDIYWDDNTGNNHMYLSDDDEYFFGWENDVSNDDTDNDGIPDTPAVTYSDFNENTLGIFDGDTTADGERANYFRMIFRAKDPNAGGDLRKVEISYNGGSSWTTAFDWNGSALVSQDSNKYAKGSVDSEGYTWFYIDIDTSTLGSSEIIKVKVTDNNNPTPYFSISSVQVTSDNTAPTGSFVAWGTSDPLNKKDFDSTNAYVGGNADDSDTGIRNVKLYFWDNQGTPETPSYDSGSGSLTASVDSGTYYVDIPNLSEISPTDPADNEPDYMVEGTMYTSQNWRILDIYSDIHSKYGVNPLDGIKLACLEVTDNAGNVYRTFKEFTFSEYPPTIDSANMWWNSMASGDKIALPGETTSDRVWISGNLNMDGSVSDAVAGDPAPGINRIRVYIKSEDGATTYATWSTESDGNVEITPSSGLPYSGTGAITWTLSAQDTSTINGGTDGNYLLVVEVQDKVGVLTTKNQYIYIDNTAPTLVVSHPTEGFAVTGDFKIDGTGSDLGGYETGCIKIEILNGGSSTGTEWTVTPDGSDNWSQWWDTSSPATFDSLKVTFTDKAKNTSVITRTISRDASPPHYTSYSVTDPDGAATSLSYSSFTSLYSIVSGHDVHIVHDNLSFDTTIVDDSNITDAGVYFSGELQSDGSTYPSSGDDYTQFTNNTGTSITNTTSKTTLSSGEYIFRAWIEQQSGAIEVNLKKYFIVDEQKPHIWLVDMQATDYDLSTDSSTAMGHIDVGLDSNGESDGDDDVSGVIKVYVKVFDNYLIRDVRVRCTDIDFGDGAGSWTVIAERNTANGTWTNNSNGSLGDVDYWSVSKSSETLAANENSMTLVFTFNTANVSNVAGLTKNLEFEVYDMAGNLSDETGQSSEQSSDPSIDYQNPDTNYQRIARKPIDIVPYITNITRSISTERTKYGKFLVQQGETGLTLTGFNLAQTGTYWVRVYNTAGSAYDDVSISGAGSPYTSMTMSFAAVTHSGWLRVAVNGVEGINNVNDNTRTTNKEDDGSGISSTNWNDDRYMHVWEVGDYFEGSDGPEHPSMTMDTATDTLYGAWSQYPSSDYDNGTSHNYGSATNWQVFSYYDPPEWTDIAYGTSARHSVYLRNYYNGGTSWGYLTTYDSADGTAYIEHLGDDDADTPDYSDGLDETLYQFQNPRITLNGDYNYVSYYDSYAKCLKYAITVNTTNTFAAYSSHQTDGDTVVDGQEDTTAPPTSTGDNVGLYSDIGFDPDDNVPVIIYYDTTNLTLKLARGYYAHPTINHNGDWNIQNVLSANSYIGYYVSMKIDSNGDIHAVAYKSSTGDLIYLHASDVDGTGSGITYTFDSPVTIDSDGAVGAWCDITLSGTTPYVSYLNSSMIGTWYGLKYAYYDTSKSDWEYGIIPASTSVDNKRTSIEVSSTATWGNMAIGYGSSTFDIVYSKPEE